MALAHRLLTFFVFALATVFSVQASAKAPSDSDQQNVFLVLVTNQAGEPSTGSSFAIGPELLVTNNHVVNGASRIEVVRPKSSELNPAEVIWTDRAGDMALLRVPGLGATALTFASARPGDGDTVWAVGFPGFSVISQISNGIVDNTVTKGEVGSIYPFSYQPNSPKITVFQHTAEISGGNSGGPLFDDCGRVVGLNTAGANREVIQANLFISTVLSELEARLRQASPSPTLTKTDGECVNGVIETVADEPPPAAQEPDEALELPEEVLTDEDLALIEDMNPDGTVSEDGLPIWLVIVGAVFVLSSIALVVAFARDKKATPTKTSVDPDRGGGPSNEQPPGPPIAKPVPTRKSPILQSTNGRPSIVLDHELLSEAQGVGIGRVSGFNDIVLDNEQISRRHSRITLVSGVLHIEDLNSSNGTLVNSVRLDPFKPRPISPNDFVTIGNARYQLGAQE